MPANTEPIYSKSGNILNVELGSTANTKSDGSGTCGTDVYVVGQVDATNGGFVRDVTFWPTATTAATAMTPSTLRVFGSSVGGTSATTAANTYPLGECAMTAQTADHSTAATFPVVVPINKALPAGHYILVTQHVAPAANTKVRATSTIGAY